MNWYRALKTAQTSYAPADYVGKNDEDEYTEDDPYGYWVLPDGQLLTVTEWEGHSQALDAYDKPNRAGTHPNEWLYGQDQAFKKGWIRLRIHGVCAIEATQFPTPTQITAIMGVFRSTNAVHCDKVFLDIPGMHKTVPAKFVGNYLKPQPQAQPAAPVAPNAVTAAQTFTKSAPYGWWVNPKGESFPVINLAGHDAAIKKLTLYNNAGSALANGWIRVTTDNPEFCGVECTVYPNEQQTAALSRIVSRMCGIVWLEIASAGISTEVNSKGLINFLRSKDPQRPQPAAPQPPQGNDRFAPLLPPKGEPQS